MILYMKGRKKQYNAEGEYFDNKFVVKTGSLINPTLAVHVIGGDSVKECWNDRKCVSKENIVIKDCIFRSPSTAALFVSGYSMNGYTSWKNERGVRLKELLLK